MSNVEPFTTEEIVIPDRLRSGVNEATVAALVESIARIGLQSPPTVRWDRDKAGDESVVLVTGRHRLEACKRLGKSIIECVVFSGDETEARLWEIAENLHRADLTVQERAEHIAEWVKLTAEKVAQVEPPLGGVQPREQGIRKAVRELGIDRNEAQRAVKIASLSEETKAAAREAGFADNQSALLRIAREPSAETQLAAVKREAELAEASRLNRKAFQTEEVSKAEEFAELLCGLVSLDEAQRLADLLSVCKAKDAASAIFKRLR